MSADSIIYLDNAATSWPKPAELSTAMSHFLQEEGGNPGRSGHRLSIAAGRAVAETRQVIANLLGVADPLRIAFGHNGTEAINTALTGILRPGDHVITSSMEHNAVMRPLRALEENGGINVTVVPCSPTGELPPDDVEKAIRPNTKLVVLMHASNVTGAVLPIAEVARICRRHDLLFLVDTAATAGAIPIHMEETGIDLLAFTGHKSLLGPTGTGGLVVGPRVDLARFRPLVYGGTGSRSDLEKQPEFLPDRFESGTLNAVGLAGLKASVQWILDKGVEEIAAHHSALRERLCQGLDQIPGVTRHKVANGVDAVSTVSITLDSFSVSEAGYLLDSRHNIMSRVGLHCAPVAHRTIGTFPHGTIRLAPGTFSTEAHIDTTLAAIAELMETTP